MAQPAAAERERVLSVAGTTGIRYHFEIFVGAGVGRVRSSMLCLLCVGAVVLWFSWQLRMGCDRAGVCAFVRSLLCEELSRTVKNCRRRVES